MILKHWDKIYDIWCDSYLVGTEWEKSVPMDDPKVTAAERWVLYSIFPTFHKITGGLIEDIYSTLGYQVLFVHIANKHNIPKAAFDHFNSWMAPNL